MAGIYEIGGGGGGGGGGGDRVLIVLKALEVSWATHVYGLSMLFCFCQPPPPLFSDVV